MSALMTVQPQLLFGAEYNYGSLERKNAFDRSAPEIQASMTCYINKHPDPHLLAG